MYDGIVMERKGQTTDACLQTSSCRISASTWWCPCLRDKNALPFHPLLQKSQVVSFARTPQLQFSHPELVLLTLSMVSDTCSSTIIFDLALTSLSRHHAT